MITSPVQPSTSIASSNTPSSFKKADSTVIASADSFAPTFSGRNYGNKIKFNFEGPRWAKIGNYLDKLNFAFDDVSVTYVEQKGLLRAAYLIRIESDSIQSLYNACKRLASDMENHQGEPIPILEELVEKVRARL